MASFYFGNFKPHLVANTQLYYQRKDSTVSLCPDYSPNGYNLTQAVALQQPTLGADSIDFDGSNDFMSRSVTSPFIADTQGTVFFSINAVSGVTQRILIINNTSTTLGNNSFQIQYLSNKIRIIVRNVDRTINNTFDTVNNFGTGYLYGSITSNGSSYTLKVNGVVQAVAFVSGSNTGAWFSSITSTTVIRLALTQSSTLFLYEATKLNKLYYNNGTLSAIDQWKIEQFMSNPLNYI